MNEITVVSAFFDIGRGNWTPDKGLPHYLVRTTDTYFERFGYMSDLDNDMVIFTTADLKWRIRELRKNKPDEKTIIITVPYPDMYYATRDMIWRAQTNPKFKEKVSGTEVQNPEYWSPDYVLINYLKSTFVNTAIRLGHVRNERIAWLDFGYCRNKDTTNGIKEWKYPFETDKMHLFNFHDYTGQPIEQIIYNNFVYIFGAKIVGGIQPWKEMEKLIQEALMGLVAKELIDDDQTLLLLSYLAKPELFKLHKIPDFKQGHDSFVVFKDFSE